MNLIFRLLITLIRCRFTKKHGILEPSSITFTALPLDIDINMHLTNSRYFSFMDLARLHHISHFKNLYKTILKNRWFPVIAGIEIKFIRPYNPFARVMITTSIVGWDEKYLYLEQTFTNKGKTYALALVKGMFVHKSKPIAISQLLKALDQEKLEQPELPETMKTWKRLNKLKREQSMKED